MATSELVAALDAFRAWAEPRPGVTDVYLRLGCEIGGPAASGEVDAAWPDASLPDDARSLWAASRESWLFRDLDYGQWGLHLLTPAQSAARTAVERGNRPGEYHPGDVVVGEFLGDTEVLVLTQAGDPDRRPILVALPLDPRPDWDPVGPDLAGFLESFLAAHGEKFWEQN